MKNWDIENHMRKSFLREAIVTMSMTKGKRFQYRAQYWKQEGYRMP